LAAPAKAEAHIAALRAVETWVPACAGMVKLLERQLSEEDFVALIRPFVVER